VCISGLCVCGLCVCVSTQLSAWHIASLASVRLALSCELSELICVQEAPGCVCLSILRVSLHPAVAAMLWLLQAVAAPSCGCHAFFRAFSPPPTSALVWLVWLDLQCCVPSCRGGLCLHVIVVQTSGLPFSCLLRVPGLCDLGRHYWPTSERTAAA
jgi:hypothetical protein